MKKGEQTRIHMVGKKNGKGEEISKNKKKNSVKKEESSSSDESDYSSEESI